MICAQVGIGTIIPDISSILDIQAKDRVILMPRLFTFESYAVGFKSPTTETLNIIAAENITSVQLSHSVTGETGAESSVFSISPSFTEVPSELTAAVGTNTIHLATTAFVLANLNGHSSVNSHRI